MSVTLPADASPGAPAVAAVAAVAGRAPVRKSCPPASLLAMLATRSLQSCSVLAEFASCWSEFVTRLREHWESAVRLPRMVRVHTHVIDRRSRVCCAVTHISAVQRSRAFTR